MHRSMAPYLYDTHASFLSAVPGLHVIGFSIISHPLLDQMYGYLLSSVLHSIKVKIC